MRDYRYRHGKRVRENCPKYSQRGQGGGRGRPLMSIEIEKQPIITKITPEPIVKKEPIYLSIAEYEAMRLVDLEDLSQEQAGELMKISRTALWRLINSARKKMAIMVVQGRILILSDETKI